MPHRVYSRQFISTQGLSGVQSVVVPAGHTYVVKFVAVYAAASTGTTTVRFEDATQGNTLLRYDIDIFSNHFYVANELTAVFEEGHAFGFRVDGGIGDNADVFAAGFDLVN